MEYDPYKADPPFEDAYKELVLKHPSIITAVSTTAAVVIEEQELPMVDLGRLVGPGPDRERCKAEIAAASKEWGFFQVVNHGISQEMLMEMAKEQMKVFREPFCKKKMDTCMNMNLSPGSYRWGTSTATCLSQLSWSEAFHIPLTDIINKDDDNINNNHILTNPLSLIVKQFASTVSELAQKLANILTEKLGNDEDDDQSMKMMKFLEENCLASSCYLRMNRYPPCPKYSHVFGLMPHTDSDFLTILYQDNVGGLQLIKDGKWIAVKPNPQALIVNIGDLFQAWSNGVYKSVEHRVVASPKLERLSMAYFLCPLNDVVIEGWSTKEEPSIYKKFSFREYRQQVQDDVMTLGYKIGLPRFLVCT